MTENVFHRDPPIGIDHNQPHQQVQEISPVNFQLSIFLGYGSYSPPHILPNFVTIEAK
jgi:hypothetical protein